MEEHPGLEAAVARFRERSHDLPVILDTASNWYQGWYFHLRLMEEVARAKRHTLPVALIYMVLKNRRAPAEPAADNYYSNLSQVVTDAIRSTDVAGRVTDDEFAICLPHTDREGAAVVVERILHLLAAYAPAIGIATLPDMGEDAETLLGLALNRALHPNIGL